MRKDEGKGEGEWQESKKKRMKQSEEVVIRESYECQNLQHQISPKKYKLSSSPLRTRNINYLIRILRS
jgi:hypothetical protein